MRKPSKKLSQREVIMGFFSLFLVVFAFFNYWYTPKKKALVDLNQKMELLKKEIDTNKALVDGMQQRILASTTKTDQEPMKEYFSTSRRLATIVQQLVSDDTNLLTRLITVDKTELENDYKNVSFKVEVEGTFPSIGAFVERLESSRILAEVGAIEITRVENDLEKCNARISVTVKLLNEDEEVKK